eukprot:15434507-Alexandrium_andersonii.AAC.1
MNSARREAAQLPCRLKPSCNRLTRTPCRNCQLASGVRSLKRAAPETACTCVPEAPKGFIPHHCSR